MRHRLPPLSTLRLFEASARHLSFKKAAEELLLTPSAVSHGIQSLEQWLGTALFVRTAKGIALTQAGASYYPTVQSTLEMLEEGSRRVCARKEHRALRISAAPTFANRFLLPALGEFRTAHPQTAVSVDTSHRCVELGEGGADIAIRVGKGGWNGVIADELLRERLIPVCAADRRAEFSGQEIEDLPLIHVTTVSEDWARWAAATGRKAPSPQSGLRFDTLQMAFDAAARGLGVAIGRRPLIDCELQTGRLAPLWPQEVPCESAHWLLAPLNDEMQHPAVEAFRAWMKSRPLAAGPVC